MSATNGCSACGMPVKGNAYHPYAACLMFKASKNSAEVLANLAAVAMYGAEGERSRLRDTLEALRDKRKADLDTMRSPFIAGEVNAFDRVLALLAEPGE